jgi:hypothetical protein
MSLTATELHANMRKAITDSVLLNKIHIGLMVVYTAEGPPQDPRSAVPKVDPDFPAIIYKVYEGDDMYVGLYVFTDNGMRQMRKVTYSVEKKVDTWRFV